MFNYSNSPNSLEPNHEAIGFYSENITVMRFKNNSVQVNHKDQKQVPTMQCIRLESTAHLKSYRCLILPEHPRITCVSRPTIKRKAYHDDPPIHKPRQMFPKSHENNTNGRICPSTNSHLFQTIPSISQGYETPLDLVSLNSLRW